MRTRCPLRTALPRIPQFVSGTGVLIIITCVSLYISLSVYTPSLWSIASFPSVFTEPFSCLLAILFMTLFCFSLLVFGFVPLAKSACVFALWLQPSLVHLILLPPSPLYCVLFIWFLTWFGVNLVVGFSFICLGLICKPSVTGTLTLFTGHFIQYSNQISSLYRFTITDCSPSVAAPFVSHPLFGPSILHQ